MNGYFLGVGFGLAAGLVLGLPLSEEQKAIDAFNSGAVYITEDNDLCLVDLEAEPDSFGQPEVVACVDIPAP